VTPFKQTEEDTRANYIDPALVKAGWDQQAYVWREYFYTDGMKLIGNKRGRRNKVDYLLRHNNTTL
jgi:type I restriction enzyme R subunit